MAVKFAKLILMHRLWVIFVALVIVMIAGVGLKNAQISTDYRDFFSKDNPQLLAFESLQNIYDKSDNVTFIVTPKDGRVFTQNTLASIEWLTKQAWQTPYSNRVDSITNHQHTQSIEDDLEVANLVTDPNIPLAELNKIKRIAINEPLLLNRLINKEATVTGVNVTVQLPGKALTEVPEIAAFVRDLAQQLEQKDPNLTVRLSGIVMMNNAFSEAGKADLMTLIPAMLLIVLFVLALLLRSITLTFATLFIIILSIVAAMGSALWFGIKLEPVTMSAPTIILTMAVADAVHLLSTYLKNLRNGSNKHNAMIESLRINIMPIFLTSITTALGFLSMNFSEVPPLAHLGNIVAVGVMVAFILSVTFLPAIATLLPVNATASVKHENAFFVFIADFVINNSRILFWFMLLVSLVLIAFVPKNQINDEFVKYFSKKVEFRQDTEYAAEHLIGPYTLEISVQSNEEGGIADPIFLHQIEQLVNHLKTYSTTTHVVTLTDTFKRLNKSMHGDDNDFYRLPETREHAAQFLLLYEMSLTYGLNLSNQIDVAKSSTRLILTTGNMSSQQVLDLEKSIQSWVHTNLPNLTMDIASPNLMFAHIGQRNAQSLLLGAALALIFISLILVVALRSLKIGLISLIPNLIPAGIAFGIWGIIDGQVGMSVSIVAGMTLGIVVDDSVHFLSKYLRARREQNLNAADACRYAFLHVGQALTVTTIVLVAGFLVLTLSTFKMNADMGLVTAITIASALVIDFLLLPPLLIMLDKSNLKSTLKNEKAAMN